MKLRVRLTIFTVSLVVAVVTFISVLNIVSLRFFFKKEMQANQLIYFANFKRACEDALYLGDDLAVQSYSESLEKSVPGLAFAVFSDTSRGNIVIGGMESGLRFKQLRPPCGAVGSGPPRAAIMTAQGITWQYYCKEVKVKAARGGDLKGTVYLGFNINLLQTELQSFIRRLSSILIWAMLFVLAIGLAAAYVLASRITKPIQRLTEGAKAIGEGKLDTQIPIESTDELGFLAQEFNLMATKLRELDQLKDDFISSVSHELRSPLSAIAGYVELLASKPLHQITPQNKDRALTIIQESTARLTHFINDILDLAKIKSGHVDLREGPFSVRRAMADVVNLFQPLLDKKKLACIVDIPATVPEIVADGDKVRQVLTNLLSNALKYTPVDGTIRISARNQNEFLEISIKDSGIGISDASKATIFEKFRQAKGVTQGLEGQKGTGLGLAIAKGIVETHGGRIWIESEVGKGTTVRFTLPNRPVDIDKLGQETA